MGHVLVFLSWQENESYGFMYVLTNKEVLYCNDEEHFKGFESCYM